MKKNKNNKTAGVSKGAPSGFLISLGIHAAAFFLAGIFVVFTVVQKQEQKFEPPKPVDRPKMKLKKPKVKVKKTAKPRATQRIVTNVKKASMPDIQLPEMSGTGLGEVGGAGFFEMPTFEEVSQFGLTESIGSDLEGTYYDFNRDRLGRNIVTDPSELAALVARFFTEGWNTSLFKRYYQAPQKLYASSFAMPPLVSTEAPKAFGEPDAHGWCWLAHYKGQLVNTQDIKFRFWGFGDDIIAVRVGGELVFLSCFPEWKTDFRDHTAHLWQSSSPDNEKYPMGNHHSVVGDWIELKANEPKDIEVLLGESYGGVFVSMLVVEEYGKEYEKNPHRNGPCLPFFKTSEFTLDMKEIIYSQLQPGEATCEGGPVFNDYYNYNATNSYSVEPEQPVQSEPAVLSAPKPELRTWTSVDGQTFEAAFKTVMGKSAVLESKRGKQKTVPLSELSESDRVYVTLQMPPEFKVSMSRTSNQQQVETTSPWLPDQVMNIQIVDNWFKFSGKPASPNLTYDRPLTVEYFVFAEESGGNNYALVDRHEEEFTPSPENKGEFEIASGRNVELKLSSLFDGGLRGLKYGGWLVTITDERGYVIQHKATHEFLFENLENLKKVPIGKHFDSSCSRTMPTRPREQDRCPWN